MGKPIITAKVKNLKQDGWIDIYANGWLIGSVWGKAKVRYLGDDPILTHKYQLLINGTDTFLYVDAIKRRVEAVEPIREAVGVR